MAQLFAAAGSGSAWDGWMAGPITLFGSLLSDYAGAPQPVAQLIGEAVTWALLFPVFTIILAHWPFLYFFDYVDRTHKPEWIYKRKIQPGRTASPKLLAQQSLWADSFGSLPNMFIKTALIEHIPYYIVLKAAYGFHFVGDVPSVGQVARDVVVGLLVLDVARSTTWFYMFNHWLWHANKTLYRYVHKFHHEYMVSNIYTHNYFNLAESYLTFLFIYLPPAYLLKLHGVSYLAMITTFQLIDNFWHCGYYLPFLPMNWFPAIWSDQTFHDFHHRRPDQGAYGLFIRPLDTIFGTDTAYAEWRAKWKKFPAEAEGAEGEQKKE